MLSKIIRQIINESLKSNPCEIKIRYNEPIKAYTTFNVGGPADCLIGFCAEDAAGNGDNFPLFCCDLLNRSKIEGVPVFILGGGANIVVSDKGIRGIVVDMTSWKGLSEYDPVNNQPLNEDILILKSGTKIDDAVNIAAEKSLCGLEFLAGMPGTIGGALWMNARCYGSEIADALSWTQIITNEECDKQKYFFKKIENKNGEGFGYKQSPFQKMDCLILNAAFKLNKTDKDEILTDINKYRLDRKEKGHYLFPCAGSAFKNNHAFGKPTGQLIDECGLKGMKSGGAQVAPFHGNIIINADNASASDIRSLTDEVAAKVKAATGFDLEPEILFVGEWA